MKKLVFSLALVTIGTFAMAQHSPMKKMDKADMQQKKEARMQEMKQQLGLSDAQVAKLNALQEKKSAERLQAHTKQMEAKKADMKAKREQADNDLKQILTPEQYTKWQTIRKQKMEERKTKMMERKSAKSTK